MGSTFAVDLPLFTELEKKAPQKKRNSSLRSSISKVFPFTAGDDNPNLDMVRPMEIFTHSHKYRPSTSILIVDDSNINRYVS